MLTEHFTSTKRKPVKDIAAATQTGPATTILSGFSYGLESTVYAILVIGAAITAAFYLGEGDIEFALYAIALTGMGMLTTVGVIVSMDTFGPIADNAQGIGEMSGGLGEAGRRVDRAPRRRRQHDEGDHEGDGDRDGRHRRDVAVRDVPRHRHGADAQGVLASRSTIR